MGGAAIRLAFAIVGVVAAFAFIPTGSRLLDTAILIVVIVGSLFAAVGLVPRSQSDVPTASVVRRRRWRYWIAPIALGMIALAGAGVALWLEHPWRGGFVRPTQGICDRTPCTRTFRGAGGALQPAIDVVIELKGGVPEPKQPVAIAPGLDETSLPELVSCFKQHVQAPPPDVGRQIEVNVTFATDVDGAVQNVKSSRTAAGPLDACVRNVVTAHLAAAGPAGPIRTTAVIHVEFREPPPPQPRAIMVRDDDIKRIPGPSATVDHSTWPPIESRRPKIVKQYKSLRAALDGNYQTFLLPAAKAPQGKRNPATAANLVMDLSEGGGYACCERPSRNVWFDAEQGVFWINDHQASFRHATDNWYGPFALE
jgi:hypothetical protein